MPDHRADHRYYMLVVTAEFEALVHKGLGDRSGVEPPDSALLGPIMRVIFTGVAHHEAAEGICTEQVLIARHKEFCESTVLIDFLLRVYPNLTSDSPNNKDRSPMRKRRMLAVALIGWLFAATLAACSSGGTRRDPSASTHPSALHSIPSNPASANTVDLTGWAKWAYHTMSQAQPAIDNGRPIACDPARTYISAVQLKTSEGFPRLIGDGYTYVDATSLFSRAAAYVTVSCERWDEMLFAPPPASVSQTQLPSISKLTQIVVGDSWIVIVTQDGRENGIGPAQLCQLAGNLGDRYWDDGAVQSC